jgi:2-oxoisovalerate dehydrogenase E2 component (dihydrolipoyl transacylase)
MMERTIKVPDIGEGIAEVELVAWHVQPGDAVEEDQVVADVMTDKASVGVPSPFAGTVRALGGEVGQVLAVGAELIRIEVGGAAAAREVPASVAEPVPKRAAASSPKAAAAAPAKPADPPRTPVAGERPIASPSVRRRAWELGIELKDVQPSGSGGRILHADLDAFRGSTTPPAAKAPAPAPPARAPLGEPLQGEQRIPVVGVRRKIAQKMQESKRRIPHFSYVEEVDVTEVEALRARLNGRHSASRPKLTLLPFIMRAVVRACAEHPVVNARFDDEAGVVTRHAAVHLGIAAQTPNGLMVPVVRHAEALDLWASAAEVARLADAARAGSATRAELTGSTITLSSLGALGGVVTTPVINHPEVAIVGVNRIVERAVFVRGTAVPRLTMNLSSSFDHRVVDGIDAARFVQSVRGYLEAPATLFVD